jgi:aminopeptidase YwaD
MPRKNFSIQTIVFVLIVCVCKISLKGQNSNNFRKIVDTLASPSFEGRGYVDNGINRAADYIAGEFSKDSLLKLNGSYFQHFTIDVNTFPGAMELIVNNTKLIAGKDFIIDPVSPSFRGKFKTFNVCKSDLINDKYVQKVINKSAGKFLVIDERNYKTDNTADDKKLTETINFLKYGKQAGNIGTIILTNNKLDWSVAGFQAKKPVFSINAQAISKTIKTVSVSVDAEMKNKYATSNLVGYSIGKEVPDTFLVITAHYDHLGKMGSEVYFPGANDNASGISMLLNMAHYYSENPHKYSMVFIALSAEEVGLLGAKYFTEHPLFDLSKIKFLVNFDLAGTGDEGIKVVNATKFPDEFERLKALNDSLSLLPSVQPRGEACNSDHCLFYEKIVPCFYIYTLGGIKAYHDIYDRPETLPLTKIEDYFKLMVKFFELF